ncbi:hypothetical protein AAMO2058_000049500 [Amorphochlora amoebiformis]
MAAYHVRPFILACLGFLGLFTLSISLARDRFGPISQGSPVFSRARQPLLATTRQKSSLHVPRCLEWQKRKAYAQHNMEMRRTLKTHAQAEPGKEEKTESVNLAEYMLSPESPDISKKSGGGGGEEEEEGIGKYLTEFLETIQGIQFPSPQQVVVRAIFTIIFLFVLFVTLSIYDVFFNKLDEWGAFGPTLY